MKCRISSSINNFEDKINKRYGMEKWHWLKDRNKSTYFFGLYHIGDYLRFLWHKGKKKVIWCGSDILNLRDNKIWQKVIHWRKAEHLCENEVEAVLLRSMGINAKVQPLCFDDPKQFELSYKQSDQPHVFVCCHPGSEEQYGVNMIEGIAWATPLITYHIYGIKKEIWYYKNDPSKLYNLDNIPENVIYHGKVSNERFNEEIKDYQAGLRLNDFDGFAEVLAKSVLMGQWPISRISYPFISYAKDITALIALLNDLHNKKEPNLEGRKYWLNEFNKPL